MFYQFFYSNNKLLSSNFLETNMECSLINIFIQNYLSPLEHQLFEEFQLNGIECTDFALNTESAHHEN